MVDFAYLDCFNMSYAVFGKSEIKEDDWSDTQDSPPFPPTDSFKFYSTSDHFSFYGDFYYSN